LADPGTQQQDTNWCNLVFHKRVRRFEGRFQAADFAWKILTNLASCQVRQNGEQAHHFGELKNKSLNISYLLKL